MGGEEKKVKVLDKYPGTFGTTTNPTNPDQLVDFESKIWEGIPVVEIGAMNSQMIQSIPKEMFNEIASKARLTGVKVSIHAPVQDVSLAGFSGETRRYTEDERKVAKYRLKFVLDRAVEMAKRLGYNVPVNIHTSAITTRKWDKEWEEELKKKLRNRIQKEGWKPWYFAKSEILVFEPTGELLGMVEGKKIKTPEGEKLITIKDEVERNNWKIWQEQLSAIRRNLDLLKENLQWAAKHAGEALYNPSKVGSFYNAIRYIDIHTDEIHRTLERLYDWAIKYGNDKQRKEIERLRNIYLSKLQEIRKNIEKYKKEIERLKSSIDRPTERYRDFARYVFDNLINLQYYQFEILDKMENALGILTAKYGPPKLVKPATEYELEKASETLSDLVSEYISKYYKEPRRIPKIVIENVLPEFPLSRAEELAMLIEEARKKAVKKLLKNEKIKKELGEKKVKELVNKLLGATWDVGHIYALKKAGYSEREILEETKKIAPYVKHVHITDNYGDYDTHLVPGMGEVPYKKMLEEIKKAAEEEGMFIISEAGGWYQRFAKTHGGPTPYLYSDLGLEWESSLAPYMINYQNLMDVYSLAAGGAGPYIEITPDYAREIYPMLPEYLISGGTVTQYHPLGARVFSMLPPELGGQGKRQTFTGRPLE